jgi:hypothetical protein
MVNGKWLVVNKKAINQHFTVIARKTAEERSRLSWQSPAKKHLRVLFGWIISTQMTQIKWLYTENKRYKYIL